MAATTSTTYTNRILTEEIHARALEASLARVVALNHCSFDSIAGMPTKSKAYPRLSDLGAAAAASEGTNLTATTTLAEGTQLSLSVTEAAAVFSTVTDTAIERRIPGVNAANLVEALDGANRGAVISFFAEEFMRHYQMCMEKAEVDVMALLDDFSTSVGTSGVDFSASDAESAIYQLTNKETNREMDWVFLLAPIQVSDLRKEIALTGGGLGGGVWSSDVQSIINRNPSVEQTGLVGSFWGIPVYQTATSTNPSPNTGANEAGALMVSGGGRSPDDRPGALVFLEGQEMKYRFQPDITERHTELVTIYEYAVGERADDMGISIITDA